MAAVTPDRAKQVVAEFSRSFAELALAVGFAVQSQFFNGFKRVAGKTPGAWHREQSQ